jgi:hypothetical protein
VTIDAPQLTQVLNLLIAVSIFGGVVGGGLWKLRKWQLKDMQMIVTLHTAPLAAKQTEMAEAQSHFEDRVEANRRELAVKLEASQKELAAKVESNQKELTEAFSKLNSSVLGHESRISFVEGKEAGRVEGYTMREKGMPLRPQIPLEEQEL